MLLSGSTAFHMTQTVSHSTIVIRKKKQVVQCFTVIYLNLSGFKISKNNYKNGNIKLIR